MNNQFAKLIVTLIIILCILIIYFLISRIINRIFNIKGKIPLKKRKTFKNFFLNVLRVLLFIIGVILILGVYDVDTTPFITSLSAITVVIGLSFQDMLKDVIAGVVLVFENSFDLGDFVTINDFKGEVIKIGIKATRIKSASGEVLIINNGEIKEVINHSIENSLAVVTFNIPYSEDTKKIEKILTDLCERLSKELPNLKGEVKLLGIDVLGSNITYKISCEVLPLMQYSTEREIRKQIKLELDKNNISSPNMLVVQGV